MKLLGESIKKTISVCDGYKLGMLIIENGKPIIDPDDGEEFEATNMIIEILTNEGWYRLSREDYEKTTAEGWPLFAGFDCRYKEVTR